MRRSVVAMILVLLLTIVTACASTGNVAKESNAPVIDRIVQRGEIVVGTAGSMPPLNMTTKEGDVVGLDVDLARLIASAMGVQLRLETMPFPELLPAMEAGKIDMIISGMTMTPRRNLKVAFVGPYFKSGKAFLTKVKTIAAAKDASDINSPGTVLVALESSTSQEFVEKLIPKARLVTTRDYDEAINMVINDEAHAMVADYTICAVSVIRYPDKGLLGLVTPITYEPLGIAIPAGDPHLVNWTENLLASLKASGGLDKLKERWFSNGAWLSKLP
jgi:polar amino acid transport system substrate-binding protein